MPTGVWLLGARGAVAVSCVTGVAAMRAGLTGTTGCVTELPQLRGPALPALPDLVFGGHDVVTTPLPKRAEGLAAAGVVPARLAAALADELAAIDPEIRPVPTAATQHDAAMLVAGDISDFRRRHGLERVVVINLTPSEPAVPRQPAHQDRARLAAALATSTPVLPASSLYAYASFEAGCPYVDFTPSTGARLPALDQLARHRRVPYAGNDAKTGETLVRSALAPMFAMRHLRVRSWSGVNLLGGGDGANLADPNTNAAKAASKQRVLSGTLGYQPDGATRIEYVADLGDHKRAWDLITFQGFLDTAMHMEFSWHGCDSALAAPLVIDLARLTAAAHRVGRTGPLPELAFFFKDPIGDASHSLPEQWPVLVSFAQGLGDA